MSIPVNSRSLIERGPSGLVGDTSSTWICFGHGTNQTNGASGLLPAYQAPPTPHLLESTKPLYACSALNVSSFTWDGRLFIR